METKRTRVLLASLLLFGGGLLLIWMMPGAERRQCAE